jgi:pyruvate,water dikinase
VGGDEPPVDGDVLVVRTLDPTLAPLLPRLGGLVAETGSPLSHLAILAREHRVPTVVGRANATTELRTGQLVRVDGDAGTVEPITDLTEEGAP